MKKTFILTIIILLLGTIAILIKSLYYSQQIPFIEKAQLSVSDMLDYPDAGTFKDVNYYYYKMRGKKQVGFVCGYVSRHYDFAKPQQYKKFIIKVFSSSDLDYEMSLPFIDGNENIMTSEQIDNLWNIYCYSR